MPIASNLSMGNGVWIAALGATNQSDQLDIISNNLSNASTNGFKKDLPTFKEYLALANYFNTDIPRGPIKDREFYPLDGRDQSYANLDRVHTNYQQGGFRSTQSQFDIGLDGGGFFEILTPSGTAYTRNGSFKVDPNGWLVTVEGHFVLAEKPTGMPQPEVGDNSISRRINLKDRGSQIVINEAGEIYSGEDFISKFSIIEFKNFNQLKKKSSQLFENLDKENIINQTRTIVRQGMIEGSNVNPVNEIFHMITTSRLFEQNLKALKTYNEIMGREVNDIGKL